MSKLKTAVYVIFMTLSFLLSILFIILGTYAILSNNIHTTIASLILPGLGLFILSFFIFIFIKTEYNKLVFRGKEYSISRENAVNPSEDQLGSDGEPVMDLLQEISSQIEDAKRLDETSTEVNYVSEITDELRRYLEIQKYANRTDEPTTLRVVGFRGESHIRAKSEPAADLPKGLTFRIFADDEKSTNIDGLIGLAELTVPDSTSGDLYELTVIEWEETNNDWISNAIDDLSHGRAILKNVPGIEMDVSEQELRTTLDTMKQIQYDQEHKHSY